MPERVQPHLGDSEPIIGSVGLGQLIATGGTFPQPGSGPPGNVMAMIHTFPVVLPAFGASPCDGRSFKIWTSQALFAVLGITYGGDGRTAFDLPDLRGRVAIGGVPGAAAPPEVAMTYMVAAGGVSDAYPMVGAIGLFAGNAAPSGWLVADGSQLPIRQETVALFEAIGTTFGGNGQTWFGLPDLQGKAVVGAGQGPSFAIALGQAVDAGPDTAIACLGLNYIVNLSGTPPPGEGDGGFPDSASILGEVIAYAGPNIPDGWVTAAGQELPIAGNDALFEMIGTAFGGDGQVSFALPDLRCHMVAGSQSQDGVAS